MQGLEQMGQVGDRVTIIGAGTAGLGWIGSSEVAAFGGVCLAAVGLSVSLYYKRAQNKRLALEHRQRMREGALRIRIMQEQHKGTRADDVCTGDGQQREHG